MARALALEPHCEARLVPGTQPRGLSPVRYGGNRPLVARDRRDVPHAASWAFATGDCKWRPIRGAQPIALRSDAAGIEALMLCNIPSVRTLGAHPYAARPAGARVGRVLAHTGDGAHAQHGGLVEDLPRRQVPYPGATAPRVGEPQQSRRSLGGNGAASSSSMLPNGPFYNPQHKCRWMGMLRRGG